MIRKHKAHARRAHGLTYWQARKNRADGKGGYTINYPVLDFTGLSYRHLIPWTDD